MNLLAILKLILGTAEAIVPIFIHNPDSQKVEAVVVTTLNGVMTGLAAPATAPTTPAAK